VLEAYREWVLEVEQKGLLDLKERLDNREFAKILCVDQEDHPLQNLTECFLKNLKQNKRYMFFLLPVLEY
jgi:hypothetical protein